jgi:hypothetical protein
VRLVQVPKQIVDEMRKGFGGGHDSYGELRRSAAWVALRSGTITGRAALVGPIC